MTRSEIIHLLDTPDGPAAKELFDRARTVKERFFGTRVYLRGLLELSNSCAKDCFYCGIRRGNFAAHRYRIPPAEAVRMAQFAIEKRYGSIVLQSGEIESEENTRYIETIIRGIREAAGPEFGITLCLGEQSPEVYGRWLEAGANRYLLRIADSLPSHPPAGFRFPPSGRMPEAAARTRLRGWFRRSDRPSGPDARTSRRRSAFFEGDRRAHGGHGAVHSPPSNADGSRT